MKGSITNKLGRYFDLYQSYDMESDKELTGQFNFEPIRDAKATKCTFIKIIILGSILEMLMDLCMQATVVARTVNRLFMLLFNIFKINDILLNFFSNCWCLEIVNNECSTLGKSIHGQIFWYSVYHTVKAVLCFG